LTETFQEKLNGLDKGFRELIVKKINGYVIPQLVSEPHFGINIKKLKGYSPETWRYRIGNHRLFYLIEEKGKVVQLLTIDDRKDAYKGKS